MESFANVDVDYPDGQTNKTVVPAEIQARGFKPPVRATDGTLELGDNLAANHLNYILHDIYTQLKYSKDNSLTVVESGGDSTQGYKKYSNGDIEIWGAGTPGDDGNATITYPVVLPALTRDIMVTMLTFPDGSSMDMHVGMVISTSQSTTGFRVRCIYRTGSGTANVVSKNGFFWRAKYHAKEVAK